MRVEIEDVPPIPESLVNSFVEVFDKISHFKQLINDLKNEYTQNAKIVSDSKIQEVEDFKGHLGVIESSLKSDLSESIKDLRSGRKPREEPAEILNRYKEKQFSLEKISQDIEKFQTFIVEKKQFCEQIRSLGISYIGRGVKIRINNAGTTYVLFMNEKL